MSTNIEPISQIRERLEAKAGAASGTRQYWDCVAALLDVAECVPELLKWMNRKNMGDPSLHSEEYFIESEEALRCLARLDACANPQVGPE